MRIVPILVCLLLAATLAPASAIESEKLIVSIPQAYTLGFNNRKDNMTIEEYVTGGQTVDNWTELVTVQIFQGMKSVRPDEFRGRMEALWDKACPNSSVQSVARGVENGYPTNTWMMDCPVNPKTNQKEITWFKALAGKDTFYVVQKAYKFPPAQEQIAQWNAWLKRVTLCDTGRRDRACPAGMK